MLRCAVGRSPIHSFCSLVFFAICAAIPWIAAWIWFADLAGWPSNDDPFYAKPLALWVERGQWQWVRQYGQLTASSVAHVFAGALATVGDAFSYRALFLVCIAQQAFAVGVLYWFARRMELSWGLAGIAAASLACFPLYYGHAFTFMTDGPAAAWAAVACAFGVWAVACQDWRWLLLTSLAVGWGYWIRQTNGLILLAPLGFLWLANGFGPSGGRRLWGSLLLPAAVAVGVFEWGGWLPSSLNRAGDVAPSYGLNYWRQAGIALYGWLLIAGWFGLPWLVVFLTQARKAARELPAKVRFACHAGAGAIGILVLLPLLATRGRACLTSATGVFIQNAHFGPIFTSDMNEPGRWGSLNGVVWPVGIWQFLSLLSLITVTAMAWWGFWSVWRAWSAFSQRRTETELRETFDDRAATVRGGEDPLAFAPLACLLLIAVAVGAIVFLVEPHMDRYWLFLLPVLCVWWIVLAHLGKWRLTRSAAGWAVCWLAGNLAMSVVFTHDMLAWNHARWSWVNRCLDSGLSARQIDGGRDVNAWLRLDEDLDSSARPGDSSLWWSGFATVAVAVGPRPGWETVDRLPWPSWATGKTHELLILRIGEKTTAVFPVPSPCPLPQGERGQRTVVFSPILSRTGPPPGGSAGESSQQEPMP